jgi:MFS family permease
MSSEPFATIIVALAILLTLFSLVTIAVLIGRWAHRTGRRPWAWLLIAYVAATLLYALAGCAPAPLTVRKASMSSYDRDDYECDRESFTYGGGSGLGAAVGIYTARKEARRLYVSCMRARGYTVEEQR